MKLQPTFEITNIEENREDLTEFKDNYLNYMLFINFCISSCLLIAQLKYHQQYINDILITT